MHLPLGSKMAALNASPGRLFADRKILLGLPGSIAIKGQRAVRYVGEKEKDVHDWPPRFWKVQLNFRDDVCLAFCDARRRAAAVRIKLRSIVGG